MDTNGEEISKELTFRFENMLKTNKILFFDSEEFESLILYYLDTENIYLCKKAIKFAIEQHPYSIEIKLAQTELLIFENKLEEAMSILCDVEKVDTENEEIYFQKAMIYSKQGHHIKAIKMLEKTIPLTDDLSDSFILIGLEYLYLEKYNQAIFYFKKSLQENPKEHSALINTIYCYNYLENHTEAINFLNTYIDTNPYSEVAWHQLGHQLAAIKDYPNAANAYDMAIVIDETFADAYIDKAKSLEKISEYKKAIITYLDLLEIEDENAYILTKIGNCYYKLDNNKQALLYYLKAINQDPFYEKSWLKISDIYILYNKPDKALHFINKALSINERNYTYWHKFAKINESLGNEEEAELGYRKSIQLGNNHIDTWLNWIDILVQLNQGELALEKINTALLKYGNNSQLIYRKAGLLLKENKIVQGISSLQNALHFFPKESNILKQKFPIVWNMEIVKKIIENNQ